MEVNALISMYEHVSPINWNAALDNNIMEWMMHTAESFTVQKKKLQSDRPCRVVKPEQ